MRSKGFTLIELAVVLAVIAILAAVLTPLVSDYIDQARTTRAMSEAKTIAMAVLMHKRDVGKYPIYTSMSATTTASGAALLAGPGTTPSAFSGTGWITSTVSLITHLSTNAINAPTGAQMGRISYRGPYLGALEADPWGNQYLITATHLHSGDNWSFVISAGVNGDIETNFTQAHTSTFTVGGDDVAAVIK